MWLKYPNWQCSWICWNFAMLAFKWHMSWSKRNCWTSCTQGSLLVFWDRRFCRYFALWCRLPNSMVCWWGFYVLRNVCFVSFVSSQVVDHFFFVAVFIAISLSVKSHMKTNFFLTAQTHAYTLLCIEAREIKTWRLGLCGVILSIW